MAAGSFGRLGAGVAGPALAAGAAAAAGVGSFADAGVGEYVDGGTDAAAAVVAEHVEHPVAVSWYDACITVGVAEQLEQVELTDGQAVHVEHGAQLVQAGAYDALNVLTGA